VKASEPPRWLLIGNSRWHWAWPDPGPGAVRVEHHPLGAHQPEAGALLAWAATGAVPEGVLPHARRLGPAAVPLRDLPPWLGIDRALAGWLAWRLAAGPVLVADAGTVLSLTWVDGAGMFRGGRLMAGVALQLRAMAAGTRALPALADPREAIGPDPEDSWPRGTEAAMAIGVLQGLSAAVVEAWRDLRRREGSCALIVTGGDGPALMERIGHASPPGATAALEPDLALRALAELRPCPQARPRSVRI